MKKKIAFFVPPFPRIRSYYDMIDTAAEYHHTAVEFFNMFEFETPDMEAARKLKEYADAKNIRICCFSICLNLIGEDAAQMIEAAKQYAEIAHILDCPYLHHTVGIGRPKISEEEAFRRGVAATREIYDHARSVGVKTACEEQGYIFNGIEKFGKFLREVDRDIGVVADLGNIYQHGGNALELVELVKEKTVHVHIKDVTLTQTDETGIGIETTNGLYMNTVEIGKGCIEIKQAIDLLKKAGYDGYYALEFAVDDDDSPAIDNSLRSLEAWI